MNVTRRRVLVLCTGNSARSQMAQGLIAHHLGAQWDAYSAGTRPSGYVHELAILVMSEIGIDISLATSKSVEQYRGEPFDVVVTVCGDAAESCPLWLGQGRVVHIGVVDPALATGTREERIAAFRCVRDELAERVLGFLRSMDGEPQC